MYRLTNIIYEVKQFNDILYLQFDTFIYLSNKKHLKLVSQLPYFL